MYDDRICNHKDPFCRQIMLTLLDTLQLRPLLRVAGGTDIELNTRRKHECVPPGFISLQPKYANIKTEAQCTSEHGFEHDKKAVAADDGYACM
uniref:Uncharacterized protein n=1 Tax=Plectus sambesii TaxID=2011161 RepID=A0A914W3X1_9BILA